MRIPSLLRVVVVEDGERSELSGTTREVITRPLWVLGQADFEMQPRDQILKFAYEI